MTDTFNQEIAMGKLKKPKTVKLPGSNALGGQDSSLHDLKYYGTPEIEKMFYGGKDE